MRKIYFSFFISFFLVAGSFAQTVVVAGADAATLAGNPYSTLKAAFDKINLASQTGNIIIITIAGNTIESASATLNAGTWTSLLINPIGNSSVTGNIADALVKLSGADNVTIDGLNVAGNALAINNSSNIIVANALRFVDDASNNVIRDCNLLGSTGAAVGTGSGVVYFSSGLVTGNDNNTIEECSISASSGGNPICGIFSLGSSNVIDNSNNTLSVNNISDYFNALGASNGININSFNAGWTLLNNALYQTATRTYTGNNMHSGILITSGSNYNISNNFIGFAAPNQTGTTNMIGLSSGSLGGSFPSSFTPGGTANFTSFIGINCSFTSGGTVSSIQNNRVGGIAIYSGTTNAFTGIYVASGNADIGTVTGNIIGSNTGASSVYVAYASGGSAWGINCASSNTVNIQNNIIGGIDVTGTTSTTASGFIGIDASGTGLFSINNNSIGNDLPDNIRTGYLLTGANLSNTAVTPTAASGSSAVHGIRSSAVAAALTITNNLVHGIQVSGTATAYNGITNSGAVTGTINLNNNQLGNIDAGAVRFMFNNTGVVTGISNTGATATTTVNLNNNSIEGISAVSLTSNLTGILSSANAGVAININNNNLGSASADFNTYSAATSNTIFGFFNSGGVAASTAISISNNNIRGILHSVTASSAHRYIYSTFAGAIQNINNNTFTNLIVNTSGDVVFINESGSMTATGIENCSNNSIVTAFNKTAAGSTVAFYIGGGSSVNGSTVTQAGNNFSNVTLTGATVLLGWLNGDGLSNISGPTKTITGNIFNNINIGAAVAFILRVEYSGSNSSVSSNTISNITSAGSLLGAISYGFQNGQGTHTIHSNNISNLSTTVTGASEVYGISAGYISIPTLNVNNNLITGLSATGPSTGIIGIRITDGNTVNVNSNSINTFTGSGTTNPSAAGISVLGAATVNVGYNKIHTINQTGINTATAPVVLGISLAGGLNVTAHNNFVADLNAVNTPFADAIRGISVSSTTPLSTYNLYHNSIHVNSASALATSGTSGIYHTTNATATTAALNMIDNIIVNTSASAGAGVTAAYRRSNATLTNFASTSNYNLLYAGTPSATNLIFYDGTNSDQTLAAYQARVAARDANSISSFPNFTSSTDLHLTPDNCSIDSKGIPVAGFTNDIDADTRSITIPDMGADEFDAYNAGVLAGIVSTAVCSNKAVVNTGTIYTDASCNLIARVLPSGVSPVTGIINTCVTMDAAQLYFNGEPYVQRHYDLEPATNPATATATITMYFTDAAFALYNATNPVWPALPTVAGGGLLDPNLTNLKVTQFHGTPTGGLPTSTPGNYTGTRVLLTPVSVVLTGSIWAVTVDVSGFSGFYVHTNNFNAPLPITVNYLTGRKQGSNHVLNWKVTCVSTPRTTMTLERSSDARNYSGINTITADAARCNQPFDYTDANPLTGMNYYRLKMVDADGKVTYSTTVALLHAVKGFDIISMAPNPVVTDHFKLNIASAQSSKMELTIFDMQGRLVNRQSISVIAGYNSLPVHIKDLSAGTYTIRATMADEQSKIIRFVKQ
ncbi:MAG: T9SS type A sorting domain-containing protein [Chitinophagaceae bacterium]|nr:T9SS type A sorting domain-containing protein [Chitinophagaceae bacterium]